MKAHKFRRSWPVILPVIMLGLLLAFWPSGTRGTAKELGQVDGAVSDNIVGELDYRKPASESNVVDSNPFVIDHTMVDAAQVPQQWLDQARLLDTFFAHRSLGTNILDGLAGMADMDPGRYTIAVASSGPAWFDENNGIGHVALGSNTHPQTKIDHFDELIRMDGYDAADLVMMKFCPGDPLPFGDMPAEDIWTAYRDMMTGLEQDYPELGIVWWTFPLATVADNRGNDERAIFNNALRQYCIDNGCLVFDIADIQSHDPSGNAVISATGHEAMWNGYSTDGGHLNEVGSLRVANAFWWMMARYTGWGDTEPPDGFTLTASPATQGAFPNSTITFEVAAQREPGFNEAISLSTGDLPSLFEVEWTGNPMLLNQEAELAVSIPAFPSLGEVRIVITGKSGEIAQTTEVVIVIVNKWHLIPVIYK